MIELLDKYVSHSEDYVVAVDEADFLEHIKPSAVLQYFQDLATIHADIIGIGYEPMIAKNLAWVLSRMSVKYYRSPRIGEKIKVVTFPRKPGTAFALRDYYILDGNNNVLISSSSKWVVIDATNHMIRRCNTLFSFPDEKYFPEPPFDDPNKAVETTPSDEFTDVMSDKVRICDLDRNKHMNNARYGDIIINAFDMQWHKEHVIDRLDINFLSELKFGSDYEIYRSSNGDLTKVKAECEGKAVFLAEVQWKSND